MAFSLGAHACMPYISDGVMPRVRQYSATYSDNGISPVAGVPSSNSHSLDRSSGFRLGLGAQLEDRELSVSSTEHASRARAAPLYT
jgi:hypothetical protein